MNSDVICLGGLHLLAETETEGHNSLEFSLWETTEEVNLG